MNDLLSIINVKKDYFTENGEVAALDNISFPVKKNEFIAIVGPSGCGKSTLLDTIAGLTNINNGKIKFSHLDPKIGYMFQQDALFPWLRVLDNCLIGNKIQKDSDTDEALKLLKMYGLEEFSDKYPPSLSGGMKQRVALIRTLSINPDILLLDEPFCALDYNTRLKVSKDVYEIIKKEEKTAIMVTHDIAEAVSLADRIIILSNRPARVKKIIKIEFEEKTPIEKRTSTKFSQYYTKIWGNIDE